MRLVYRCFGTVAFLEHGTKVPRSGEITVTCDVADGCALLLYSDERKELREYSFRDGAVKVPSEVFRGGCEVKIRFGETCADAIGTPIREIRIGEQDFLVGGELGTREELVRLCSAIGYVGDIMQTVLEKAGTISTLQKDVEALKKRANSGDIFNF